MKYYFFVNPAAGQGKGTDKLIAKIDDAFETRGEEYGIILTDAAGDGEKRAREICMELAGEEARIYACGGDGTAGEIVNGIYGYDNVAFGIVPIGSGNDTVRNFPEAGDFLDIDSQIEGTDCRIDLMRFRGSIDDREQTRYCINMFNIGFDCNTVELAARLKTKPLIAGSVAYLMAVAGMLIQKKATTLRITVDGEIIRDGDLLLTAVCNGSYCGGGVKSTPQARIDDGLIDMIVINDVTRREFIKLFPKYRSGTYPDMPGIEKVIEHYRGREIRLEPHKSKDFFICADGEILLTTGVDITICPSALRFIVPTA